MIEMKQMIRILLAFICTIILPLNGYCKNANTKAAIDTTKIVFFLDGKRIYAREAIEMIKNKSADFVGGAYSTRDCLLYYGEKYRNGILIYVSRKEDEVK